MKSNNIKIKQIKKTNDSMSRKDTTLIPLRCIGCEKNKHNGRHSKIHKNPQAVWWHTWQCRNFNLITYPTRNLQISILEKISLGLKTGQPADSILEARNLGMLVK